MDQLTIDKYEKEILKELRLVTGNKNLLAKNILEYSANELEDVEGQIVHYLPQLKTYVSIGEASKVAVPESGIKKSPDAIETKPDFLEDGPRASTSQEPAPILVPKAPPIEEKTAAPDELPGKTPIIPGISNTEREGKILDELMIVTRDSTYQRKHILGWSFGKMSAGIIGEKTFYLPDLQLHVLVKKD